MAAKAESASSNGLAESYAGSLISLTSKSDIRYQGLFSNLNSLDSTIGLTNVRSFGTEGRKKDGPQVGPSDKVYEYILFRGSDIKDLKVISSPQVQAASTTHVLNDPAIVQTHYPPQAPNSSATAQPSGSVPNLNPSPHNNNQSELVRQTFQTNLPLYQPAGNLGPWVGQHSSLPTTNGNTVSPPMYYPGYYGPSNGFQPQQQQQPVLTPSPLNLTMPSPMQQSQPFYVNPLPSLSSPIQPPQQQSLLTPPPGLSMPSEFYPLNPPLSTGPLGLSQSPSSQLPIPNFQLPLNVSSPMQQATHHSNTNVPLSTGASNAGDSNLSLSPSALLPIPNFQSYLPTQSSSLSLGAFNFQSPISPTQPTAIVSESSTNSVPNNPIRAPSPNVSAKTPEPSGFSGVLSTPSITNEGAVAMPNLITPGQFLQPGPSTASLVQAPPQSTSRKDSKPLLPLPQTSQLPSQSAGLLSYNVASESKEPLLPLPTRTEYKPKANHRHHQPRHHYRGGTQWGRDKTPRPVTVFTEEFDFAAMNEKFNKDEVWGDIGKSVKAQEDANESQVDDNDDDDVGSSNPDSNHAYVKDDFFDSLSCDSIVHNGPPNERPKFSQQRKKDTETFGFVPRHNRGGGRGGYNGYSRGSYNGYNRGSFGQGQGAGGGGGYHGRGGNGYVGRGRGQNFPGRGS